MSFAGISSRHDRNKDGEITKNEFRAPQRIFVQLDKNKDGVLTKDDFDKPAKSSEKTPSSPRPKATRPPSSSKRGGGAATKEDLGELAAKLFPNYRRHIRPDKYGGKGVQPGQRIKGVEVYMLDGKKTKFKQGWFNAAAMVKHIVATTSILGPKKGND